MEEDDSCSSDEEANLSELQQLIDGYCDPHLDWVEWESAPGILRRDYLSRRGDAGAVAPQAQPCGARGEGRIFGDGKNSLFHASMVETVRVVSSRTSRSTRTVSREVKMVTLFSVAQRRMITPSSRWVPLWTARVLMM